MAFDIAATVGGITTMITIIIVLGTIGVVGLLWYNLSQYKIDVIVRDVVKGRNIIIKDKAKRIKDKNDNYWWRLLKEKVKIPEPDTACVETTEKGKKFAEMFKLKSGGYFPAKSKIGYMSIQSSLNEDDFKKIIIEGFEPLTTQERALYTHEMRESEKYKQVSKHELLAKAIPYIAIILIFTVLLLFAGEYFKPLFDHQQKMEVMQQQTWDKIELVIDKMGLIIDDKQRFTPINESVPN